MTDCLIYLYEMGYNAGGDFCVNICPKFEDCINGNPGLDEFTLIKLAKENNIEKRMRLKRI